VQGGHASVLLAESLEILAVKPGGLYVDGTVGLGGHAAAVLERSGPDGRLIGLDRDAEVLEQARERLRPFGARATLVHADYREIPRVLGDERPDGVLLDLGVSSVQLDTAERGFSFRLEGPLDMRMDRSAGESAAEVVNRTSEPDLADLIYQFGEERASRRIARAIVAARRQARIRTTTELAAIVRRAAGGSRRPGLDSATRTFQALRIHVNRELEGLGRALADIAGCLAPRGRMAVIAFHSLEDREVKRTFRELGQGGFTVLTRRPLRPAAAESAVNPRARSARLRGLERGEAE
jgi:16S rRNA (cytosine1402-N4)-methyltransferase